MKYSLFFLLVLFSIPLSAQLSKWQPGDVRAEENFRLGVLAYFKGQYNDAILAFEKGLNSVPDDKLITTWLGYAYFKTGLETIAIERWDRALELGNPSPSLANRIELLKFRRSEPQEGSLGTRYIQTQEIFGKTPKNNYFTRPSCVIPELDGTIWTVAYGSNEIVRIDPNGMVLQHIAGVPGGFDRPYALIDAGNGLLFVTESNGNRITVVGKDGTIKRRFGKTGRGPTDFMGPQNIAFDPSGYIFVVDYGNKQVKKFDLLGNGILSFGNKSGLFPGFISPTGIAFLGGSVYVADAVRKAIYKFDKDGNYEGLLVEGLVQKPESLSVFQSKFLLVCDKNRVFLLDPETENQYEIWMNPTSTSRIVSAVFDVNGNVVCADFDENRVFFLADPSSVYSGYDIRVDRINAKAFPTVDIQVSVQDRLGKPVIGLKKNNFYISELVSKLEKRDENGKPVVFRIDSVEPVTKLDLIGSFNTPGGASDCSIVIEQSDEMKNLLPILRTTVSQIIDRYAGKGELSIIKAGKIPERESIESLTKLATRLESSRYGPDWKLDTALRLAAQILSTGNPKKTIYFITSGKIHENSFSRYSLSEIAAFLRNNGIRFIAIVLDSRNPDKAINYLSETTDGQIVNAIRPTGIDPVMQADFAMPLGIYSLRFISEADSNFGKSYLPIAIEVYVSKRSGREDTGYFAPYK